MKTMQTFYWKVLFLCVVAFIILLLSLADRSGGIDVQTYCALLVIITILFMLAATILELGKKTDAQQTQIDDLKRELEEMKRKE